MNRGIKTVNLGNILIIVFFLLIGCDKPLPLSESGRDVWDNLIMSHAQISKQYREELKAKIKVTEESVYYTYRTVMLEDTWKSFSDTLPAWKYINGVKIPLWFDQLRPEKEIKLATHVPWLITDYNSALNGVEIKIPELKSSAGPQGEQSVSNPSVEFAYGDVSPLAFISESKLGGWGGMWDSNSEALFVELTNKEYSRILDNLKSNSDLKLKVYYKIKIACGYVVKVEILSNGDKLLMGSELYTSLPEEITQLMKKI